MKKCARAIRKGHTLNNSKQIIQYLEELAKALIDLQVTLPFHILIAGGAYMILQNKRQFTEDIDFALVEHPQSIPKGNQVFRVTCINADISRSYSSVPFSSKFKHAVFTIAQRHPGLAKDWMNDEAAGYYYDDAPEPEVTFWRSFGNVIYVYLPTLEYMFATKIAAYRSKDEDDINLLMKELRIKSRIQAKTIVDLFLLPEAQKFWQVEENLDTLFPGG